MGSVIGGKQRSTQNQTSQGQAISNSIQNSKSTSYGRSTGFSRGGASFGDVIGNWQSNKADASQFSRDNALKDVQGTLRVQAYDAMKSAMPQIASQQSRAGAYNSTTKELMSNDLQAKVNAGLADTALKAIQSYGQLGVQTQAANNQLLGSLGSASQGTGVSGNESNQLSMSDSSGQSSSASTNASTGSGNSSGGSALLGLFKDGGKVPEAAGNKGNSWLDEFSDMSGFSRTKMDFQDLIGAFSSDNKKGTLNSLASNNLLFTEEEQRDIQTARDVANSFMSMFEGGGGGGGGKSGGKYADGGEVNETLDLQSLMQFADGGNVPGFGEQAQIPQLPQIVINVGSGEAPKAQSDGAMQQLGKMLEQSGVSQEMQTPAADGSAVSGAEAAGEAAAEQATEAMAEEAVAMAVFADGGQVPSSSDSKNYPAPRNTITPQEKLLQAIRQYKNGGTVRSGESDVRSGGKIRGPQSPTGEDNQIIGVAGGEGIIPKDVMQVQGVPELLKKLIDTYHTPVKK